MGELAKGRLIAGKYRLETLVGVGGMGEVWRARHLHLDMPVAIKFMEARAAASPEARSRFEREAKAIAKIRSPHVVQVTDHGVDGGTPYMVMELLEGEDLGVLLRRVGKLSLAQTARIVQQAAKGLRRAHEQGVIHRDLKPSNVFLARVDDDETVKVLDFGVAKLLATEPMGAIAPSEQTQAGTVLGSPAYMSPEQVRGVRDLDARADVWSLAVIAFRMLTGEKPFEADTIGELVVKLCVDPLPKATKLAPELPEALDAFFDKAFSRTMEQRFASATELAAALVSLARLYARPEGDDDWLDKSVSLSARELLPLSHRASSPGTLTPASGAQLALAASSSPPSAPSPSAGIVSSPSGASAVASAAGAAPLVASPASPASPASAASPAPPPAARLGPPTGPTPIPRSVTSPSVVARRASAMSRSGALPPPSLPRSHTGAHPVAPLPPLTPSASPAAAAGQPAPASALAQAPPLAPHASPAPLAAVAALPAAVAAHPLSGSRSGELAFARDLREARDESTRTEMLPEGSGSIPAVVGSLAADARAQLSEPTPSGTIPAHGTSGSFPVAEPPAALAAPSLDASGSGPSPIRDAPALGADDSRRAVDLLGEEATTALPMPLPRAPEPEEEGLPTVTVRAHEAPPPVALPLTMTGVALPRVAVPPELLASSPAVTVSQAARPKTLLYGAIAGAALGALGLVALVLLGTSKPRARSDAASPSPADRAPAEVSSLAASASSEGDTPAPAASASATASHDPLAASAPTAAPSAPPDGAPSASASSSSAPPSSAPTGASPGGRGKIPKKRPDFGY